MNKACLLITTLLICLGMSQVAVSKPDKEKPLPPGLQKKAERGESLPPGWQKKVAVGKTLDLDVYHSGKVIARDDKGLVTISVEGGIIKVIENTREIVEILSH